ncbi:MAG TPA: hypothetical protein VI411_06995 [Actinomycetota bacterium]
MRRGIGIAVLLLVILGGIAIGVTAYNAGVSHGLAEATTDGQVVRVVGPGYGFFPFGLFLFPLFFFGFFALARLSWGQRWGGHGHGFSAGGSWGTEGPKRFEEWHRRQHEQGEGDHTPAGGEPASV